MKKTEQETKKSNLAEEIKYQRRKRHWSQEDLAFEAGVSIDVVGRIEREQCNPRIENVEKIEKALGLPPYSLLRTYQLQVQSSAEVSADIDSIVRRIHFELEGTKLKDREMRIFMNITISVIQALAK